MGKGASKITISRRGTANRATPPIAFQKQVLIFGGNGNVGNALVSTLKRMDCKVVTVDFQNCENADETILMNNNGDLFELVNSYLAEKFMQFDMVINCSGGFEMGNLKSVDLMHQYQKMMDYNVKTAFGASQIASRFLYPSGLFVLFGSAAATTYNPNMIAYSIAKSAVHTLVKTLAMPGSGMPDGSTTVAVLPVILDTPENRRDFTDGDVSTFTPLNHVAEKICDWMMNSNSRPANGALIGCETKKGITSWKSADSHRFSVRQSPTYRPKSVVSKTLSEVLENFQERSALRSQLRDEFATENLDFYDAVLDFSKNTPTDVQVFQSIYERFVVPTSPRAVNLADSTIQQLTLVLNQQATLNGEVFRDAIFEVRQMLDETFVRMKKL